MQVVYLLGSQQRWSVPNGESRGLQPVSTRSDTLKSRKVVASVATNTNNISLSPAIVNGVGDGYSVHPKYDIFGLGEAIVDYSGVVPDEYLEKKGLLKGGRRVITVEERAHILQELEGNNFKLQAGGSLANTLVGVASLSSAMCQSTSGKLRVGMSGCIGQDHMGEFFREQLHANNVEWVGSSPEGAATGTVVVLGSRDAQRSFLSLPSTGGLNICPSTASGIASTKLLVIEGYLWDMPGAIDSIHKAIAFARAAGSLVAMTAADVSVVKCHRESMLQAAASCDVLFANEEEAKELVSMIEMPEDKMARSSSFEAQEACLALGELCPMAVITRGSKGSCVAALGQLHVIPPRWTKETPVDTCGAGDAYAAGYLHAYLQGMTVREMGEFGSACASHVISKHCSHLTSEDASPLVSLTQCLEGAASP